jgi:D-alanyl-D-alanine carboxypeptidase (penicillin-binding protein 5/6)
MIVARLRLAVAGATVALVVTVASGAAASAIPSPSPTPTVVGGAGLATTGTVVGGGAPPLPAVTGGGWLVADLGTGDVLAAHDPHGRYAPASCLKMLTADVVIPRLPLTAQAIATSDEAAVDGTRVGLVPGHAYSVDELLQAMLLDSGNDAATALAVRNGGVAATIAEMNDRARDLHADDTVARTVDGLDAAGQTSSAYDLALVARAAMQLPTFRTDVATPHAELTTRGEPSFQFQNHNPLLGVVPGVVGVKNGYTVAAQASYVGVARRGGTTILVSFIRTRPDFAAEATALLDWGFAADGHVAPVGTLVAPGTPVTPAAALAPASLTPQAVARHHRGGSDLVLLALGASGAVVVVGAGRWQQQRHRRRRRYTRRSWG